MKRDRIHAPATGRILAALLVVALAALAPAAGQTLEEAQAKLRHGVNTWVPADLESARAAFLGLMLKEARPDASLVYYLALTDYRLASCHLAAGNRGECERFAKEGQEYASQASEADSSSGEPRALLAFLLSLEIALYPDRAMSLGMRSMQEFAQALEIDPDNPRVLLLKGIYQIYTPEAFGGGPESAIEFLDKAVARFEEEKAMDPRLPSWGKEEAYTWLGRIYAGKKEWEKAKALLTKALAVNPDFGLAKAELEALSRDKQEK